MTNPLDNWEKEFEKVWQQFREKESDRRTLHGIELLKAFISSLLQAQRERDINECLEKLANLNDWQTQGWSMPTKYYDGVQACIDALSDNN